MPKNQKPTNISISPIKAFSDNYIWCISSSSNNTATLVDPGDADSCINYLIEHQLVLSSILVTHHHSDHVGGINKLVDYCHEHEWPLTIYGPTLEAAEHCDVHLVDSDTVNLVDLNMTFTVIDIPGHTLGHIAYYDNDNLFCGDTLFSGGCGRIFEGTAEQMYQSLNKLSELPETTRVYCAHEYTLANLNFALSIEPDNLELIDYYNHVKSLREKNKPSIPSTIAQEKKSIHF